MVRNSVRLALAALAVTASPLAFAQQTSAPQAAEAPAKLDAAVINAIVNAALPEDQAAMKAHVMFLASDAMKGRDTGSPEYDIAAQYVAAQFYAAGLRPAGDAGSYLQRVPLIRYKPADKGSFVITRKSGPQPLEFGVDYIPGADAAKASLLVEAPVVFVGHGVVAPNYGRDDYRGVDVRGKIVVYFRGAPSSFSGEERAHFGSNTTKLQIAAARGAIGAIVLESPVYASVLPFSREVGSWDEDRVTWVEPSGKGHNAADGIASLGAMSAAGGEKLFAGAKTPWAKIWQRAENGEARFKPMALPTRLTVSLKTESSPIESSNVAGLLPGSDPAVGSEVVVLSAHLDHVGTGAEVNGDAIYNGAMDNAVGIASLIEEAKRFKASGKPPKRSILFLAVTAEEKGLIGADYFAHNPTVPKAKLIADVNLDMPVITYKFEDVIAFGADRSTLGPIVRQTAANMGLAFGEDPMPEQGLFVRSDHYRFVQQGIPSVFLWPGLKGPGKAAFDVFFKTHYHKPSDDLAQEPRIDWSQGVRFIEANYAIARAIADADERPRWNEGDFFGTLYGGYGAK